MKTVVRATVFSLCFTSAWLLAAGSAGAASLPANATLSVAAYAQFISAKAEKGSKKPRKHSAKKRAKGGGVSFHDGSAESRSERDRRLMRECKGRSNSGVCEGYTR